MDITSFSREKIKSGLEHAKSRLKESPDNIRMLFSPRIISDENFDEVCEIYSKLDGKEFDTVVIVESHPGSAEKKLPMPSFKSVKTDFGEVKANDKLRNDFADEDDDFFINDDAFDEDVSLYNQLMMLQCVLDDFEILSMQITDEGSFIVKELAYALEEILASKNTLIVFCCDLSNDYVPDFRKVKALIENWNISTLMNYLNSGESSVKGLGSFVAGLIVAKEWGLNLHFESPDENARLNKNLLTGYATMQSKLIYG